MAKQYSKWISAKKALIALGLFLIPMAVDFFYYSFPQLAQLTVGAVLIAFANWFKFNYTK